MAKTQGDLRPVVYVATNHDWFAHQHFYQGLATTFAATRPVLYVGSVTTAQPHAELREVAPNIWHLRPWVTKAAGRRLVRPLSDRLVARAATRGANRLGWPLRECLIWTYTTNAAPLIRSAPAATSVYWTGDEVVDRFETGLLQHVQYVFTVSPSATKQKRDLAGASRVTEMPIANDPAPYEAAAKARQVPEDLAALPKPWFGYGGAVNGRTDWALVDALAERTSGTVVVVGPATDDEGRRQMTRADKPANLVFFGHRDATVAVDYIAAFDVAMIPYKLTAFNLGSNPVKTYDYLAAGKPVVATDLPAIRHLAPHVAIARDDGDFIELALARASSTGGEQRRQSVARQYSYDGLVKRIDEVLGPAAYRP